MSEELICLFAVIPFVFVVGYIAAKWAMEAAINEIKGGMNE